MATTDRDGKPLAVGDRVQIVRRMARVKGRILSITPDGWLVIDVEVQRIDPFIVTARAGDVVKL